MSSSFLACFRGSKDFDDAWYVWGYQSCGRLDGLGRTVSPIHPMHFQYLHRPRRCEGKRYVIWVLKLRDHDAAKAGRMVFHCAPAFLLQSFSELSKRSFARRGIDV